MLNRSNEPARKSRNSKSADKRVNHIRPATRSINSVSRRESKNFREARRSGARIRVEKDVDPGWPIDPPRNPQLAEQPYENARGADNASGRKRQAHFSEVRLGSGRSRSGRERARPQLKTHASIRGFSWIRGAHAYICKHMLSWPAVSGSPSPNNSVRRLLGHLFSSGRPAGAVERPWADR